MARANRSARVLGTAFETAVARYLTKKLGLPVARRVKTGNKDSGDIQGVYLNTQPMAVECKNPGKDSPIEVSQWWKEVSKAKKNINAIGAVLIVKRYGTKTEKSYCIFDDEIYELVSDKIEVTHLDSTLAVSKWKDKIKDGEIFSTFKHGSKKTKRWYVGNLETVSELFDAASGLPEIFLNDLDLFLLEETSQIATTTTTGEHVVINLAKGSGESGVLIQDVRKSREERSREA